MLKICKCGCGRSFVPTGNSSQYYSDECRKSNYRLKEKIRNVCICGCGREFWTKYAGRKFYSRKCYASYMYIKERQVDNTEAPFCLCGCGQKVLGRAGRWNKYISGHFKPSDETIEKLRTSKIGVTRSDEWKQLMSIKMKEHWSDPEWQAWWLSRRTGCRKGLSDIGDPPLCACGCGNPVSRKGSSKHWNKYISGHFHLEQKRIWELKRGEASYCKCGCGNKVVWSKEKHGWNEYYGHHYTKDPEYRRKMSDSMNTEEKRLELSDKGRNNYANPEYVAKVIKGWNRKPSGFERLFEQLKPDMFIKYVGDFKLWIALPNGKQKNPDFIIEGTNKVIELHGDYWHKGEDSSELVRLYKDVGYDCLVIWENEMSDIKLVMKRVSDFLKKK